MPLVAVEAIMAKGSYKGPKNGKMAKGSEKGPIVAIMATMTMTMTVAMTMTMTVTVTMTKMAIMAKGS